MYFCTRHLVFRWYFYSIAVTVGSWNFEGSSRGEFQGDQFVYKGHYIKWMENTRILQSLALQVVSESDTFKLLYTVAKKAVGCFLRQVCTFEPSPVTQTEIP